MRPGWVLCLALVNVELSLAWIDEGVRRCRPPTELYGLRGKKIRREKRKALKDPTPPRIETPYGPIRIPKPPRVCETCFGRGRIRCNVCEGRGAVRATGNNKKNSIVAERLVGSQWTSVEIQYGHRHHALLETRGSAKKKNWEARMRNCCGEQNDYWISVDELRSKLIWRKGWQTLEQIRQADGGALIDARVCFRCKGGRILPCADCDGVGEIPSYEPLYND